MISLKFGSSGLDVVRLQQALEIEQDGMFGLHTEQAVREYQRRHGLDPDGIAGPKTHASLGIIGKDLDAPLTAQSIVDRAKSALDKGIQYKLGQGGYDPESAIPGQLCDCSGFIAWILRRSRKPSAKWQWWMSTDSIWADAIGHKVLFRIVPKHEMQAGDFLVYPDKAKSQGHVAVVIEPSSINPVIIDCSYSQRGIAIRSGKWMFSRGAICARYRPIETGVSS